MSAKRRRFALGDLLPNPFRDLDRHPLDEDQVEELLQSFKRAGVWDDGRLLVRVNERGRPELCFGHHLVEAMKRHHDPETEVEVAVEDLTDRDMMLRMAAENESRRERSAFLELEVVEGVVRGFADGRLDLETPPRTARHDQLRFAPRFSKGEVQGNSPAASSRAYTAKTVANFLGWGVTRVRDTLRALELVEAGHLERLALRGKSHHEARSVVTGLRKALERAGAGTAEEEEEGEEEDRPERKEERPEMPDPPPFDTLTVRWTSWLRGLRSEASDLLRRSEALDLPREAREEVARALKKTTGCLKQVRGRLVKRQGGDR